MKEDLQNAIRDMQIGGLLPNQAEEKESIVLGALRCTADANLISACTAALSASGTIMAIPVLFALLRVPELSGFAAGFEHAIRRIEHRARLRGSLLPDAFFTPEHWRPKWQGSKTRFLSYVAVVTGERDQGWMGEDETNRIGDILVEEMNMDIAPYNTFQEFKLCATGWDYEGDHRIVLERLDEESLLIEAEEAGAGESIESFLLDHLLDLQYDYLITRLRLTDRFDFNLFAFKMARVLNAAESNQ